MNASESGCSNEWLARRHRNLREMINFSLSSFVWDLKLLRQEIALAVKRAAAKPADAMLEGADKERVVGNVQGISRACARMFLERTESRIQRLWIALKTPGGLPEAMLATELVALWDAIEDDIQYERFFHYRRDKTRPLLAMRGEWAPTLSAFKSAEKDIEEGVDCYGLEHNTACVFHMMRIAERGLRALARERQVTLPRNKPLEWGTWQDILNEVEKSVRVLGPTMAAGPAKDVALAFYNGAIAHYHGFKDMYRNDVSHVRREYGEADALRAINQVRDFMNGLSSKIGETTRRPVPIRSWR
jgi:hypothetical protein